MNQVRGRQQRGFTIIELLIATAVFAVIMLVITSAVLQFSRQYYKGVISSNTQSAARTLMDDIVRSLQYSGGDIQPLGTTGWCIGSSKRYSFALNRRITEAGTGATVARHALVSDSLNLCNSSAGSLAVVGLPADLTSPTITPALKDGREQLGKNMRLVKFEIKPNPTSYTITIRIVYGDDDLLCSPAANDCSSGNKSSDAVLTTASDLICKPNTGSAYCAVSELSTTVTKRVQ